MKLFSLLFIVSLFNCAYALEETPNKIFCRYEQGYSQLDLNCDHYQTFKDANFTVEMKRFKEGPDALPGEMETIDRSFSKNPEWNNPEINNPELPTASCEYNSCQTNACYIVASEGKKRFDCKNLGIFKKYSFKILEYKVLKFTNKIEKVVATHTGDIWIAPEKYGKSTYFFQKAINKCEDLGSSLPYCNDLRSEWNNGLIYMFSAEGIKPSKVWCKARQFYPEWNQVFDFPAQFNLINGAITADGSPFGKFGTLCQTYFK